MCKNEIHKLVVKSHFRIFAFLEGPFHKCDKNKQSYNMADL